MSIVLIDTSFALAVVERRSDVMGQLKRFLPGSTKMVFLKPVWDEFNVIADSGGIKSAKAAVALELFKNATVIPSRRLPTDKAILAYAKGHRVIVATNDRELRIMLRRNNITVTYVKRDGRLTIEGAV